MSLHPFVSALIEAVSKGASPADTPPSDYRRMAAARAAGFGKGPEMARAEDIELAGRSGAITARLLIPKGKVNGLIVFLHGGGWVIGQRDEFDSLGRAIAMAAGAAVVIPEYRLAPEHPFPAGLEDCEDVILRATPGARGTTSAFAGIAGPLILAGDSAGANLATVALRRLGKRAEAALQVLAYPVTDCDPSRPSYALYGKGYPLSARDMDSFFAHYLGEAPRHHPDVSPLYARNLAHLPPALILSAELDILSDEAEAYARALEAAGVTVNFQKIAGVTHGFLRWHNHLPAAEEAIALIGAEIRSYCPVDPG